MSAMIRCLCWSFVFAALSVLGNRATAVVTFAVFNDDGDPATNVLIEGSFLDLSPSGYGEQFRGRTGAGGRFTVGGGYQGWCVCPLLCPRMF